jgi:signal peptidase
LAGSAVSLGALAVILAVAVAAIAVPKAAGAVPLTVLSNSMAPTMPVGSLAVVKPTMPVTAGKPEELSVEEIEQVNEVSKIEPGDVIVFAPKEGSGTTVIHRVITANTDSTGRRTFMTRGDNNDAMDPPVAGYQVRGVLWYRLPWLGWVNDAMDSSTRRVVSVAVAAAGFGWAGWTLVSALAGPKRQPRRASSATGATATQTGLRGLGPNGAKDGDR